MPSTRRQLEAVHNYMSNTSHDKAVGMSLGGSPVYQWVQQTLNEMPLDDFPEERAENEIDVLGLPYGGPNGGKDNQGEFFSVNTDFIDGHIDYPPVYMTHGIQYGYDSHPIGKVKKRKYASDGGWFRVELDPLNPAYPSLIDAFHKGKLFASSGVVPASKSVSPNGHIDSWLVGELSLVDTSTGFIPVNRYAVTKADALFKAFSFEDYFGDPVVGQEVDMDGLELLQAAIDRLGDYVNSPELVSVETLRQVVQILESAKRLLKAEEVLEDHTVPLATVGITKADIKCPHMTQSNLDDMIKSSGYKSREEVEVVAKCNNLILPDSWSMMSMPPEDVVEPKCTTCEEAARLKAEIADFVANKPACQKCGEAMQWVKAMVVAGKLAAVRAYELIDEFKDNDTNYAALRAQVEGAAPGMPGLKAIADLSIAGGRGEIDPEQTVDTAWIKKQLANSGLHEVKV